MWCGVFCWKWNSYLFFGQMFEGDITSDDEVMTYHKYQEYIEELIKITTKDNKTAWVCTLCGYIYDKEDL